MLHKYSSVYFLQACIRRWELVGRPWRLRWRDWTSCLKREAGLQELQVVPRPHLTGLTLPPGMATIDLSTYFLGSIIQQKSKVPKIFWPNSLGFGTNSIPSWHKNFKNRGLVTGTNSSILVCNMTFKWKDNYVGHIWLLLQLIAAGEFRNPANDMCIDKDDVATNMDQPVDVLPCHGDNGNQYWWMNAHK